MYLENCYDLSDYKTVKMKCDECFSEYNAKLKTARKQIKEQGLHQCRICSSRRAGRKTAKKMSAIYSVLYSGDNNPAKKPGVGEKISKSKKGIKFSESHKLALRKPKKITENIKKAANLPHEVERRSRLMCKRMIENGGIIHGCTEYVEIEKCKDKLLCRSKLEKKFILKADKSEIIKEISSAEKLCLPYYYKGVLHRYLPDFRLDLKNGQVYIIEIKGSYYGNNEVTKLKMDVLKCFCKTNGFKCALLKEKEIYKWLEKLK